VETHLLDSAGREWFEPSEQLILDRVATMLQCGCDPEPVKFSLVAKWRRRTSAGRAKNDFLPHTYLRYSGFLCLELGDGPIDKEWQPQGAGASAAIR
jgi:hypothetical protein